MSSPWILSLSRDRPLTCDNRIRPEPAVKPVEIDIAAAQDKADALALKFLLLLEGSSERRRSGAFRKIVSIGPVGPHRGGDFVVRHLHDAGSALADDPDRIGIGNPCRHAVG